MDQLHLYYPLADDDGRDLTDPTKSESFKIIED